MIHIFHGDNQFDSRSAFNQAVDSRFNTEILRLDSKETVFDAVANFLATQSLFQTTKILAISNFFSITKSAQDKLIKVINQNPIDVYLWQDKRLTAVQLKIFPHAQAHIHSLPNQLFSCLNSIRPHNLAQFSSAYHTMLDTQPYDLFLYLLKNNLRKQLVSYTKFDQNLLKKTYLYLIDLDYQNKSGQLSIPKEIALERILVNLIK